LACLHSFIVYALLEIGKEKEVTHNDNHWIDAALVITWSNPDVFAAKARHLRIQALLPDNAEQPNIVSAEARLNESLIYWQQAQNLRVNWPYYALGALDVEVILDKPAQDIQQRISAIINMAPNEQGLYQNLLKLSFTRWNKLTDQQQSFMLKQLALSDRATLKVIYDVAKKSGTAQTICAKLPWNQIRFLCRV
jgi:hypothetical protein